jgi:hypothetical protein
MVRARGLLAFLCLALGTALGCGPSPAAMSADDEPDAPASRSSVEHRTDARDPGWEDAGYAYFADPDETVDVGLLGEAGFDVDAVREGCLAMVDTSRVEVARAIEVARSMRDFDRMGCLAREAQVLATLAPVIEYGSFDEDAPRGDASFVIVSACKAARASRHEAESCAASAD